jgi:hypothetical protein
VSSTGSSTLSRPTELLARLVVVAALLAGWQAALLHPLQHSDAHGGFLHLDGKPSGQPDKSGLCDVLAALTACAQHALLAFEPPAQGREGALFAETQWRLPEPPPFFAQGPPSLV